MTCKEWNEKVDKLNEQRKAGFINEDMYDEALNDMYNQLITFTAKRPKEVCHDIK